MSKIITIAPSVGPMAPSTITLTNTYSASAEENLALSGLQTLKDNQVWNTGCAAIGDPHIDETANANKVLLTDPNAWAAKHIASIPLYRTNSFVYLLPGDSIIITARSTEEAMYYWNYKSELVTVTCNFVTEGADRPDPAYVQGVYIDRTTGIGDQSGLPEEEEEESPDDGQQSNSSETPGSGNTEVSNP